VVTQNAFCSSDLIQVSVSFVLALRCRSSNHWQKRVLGAARPGLSRLSINLLAAQEEIMCPMYNILGLTYKH